MCSPVVSAELAIGEPQASPDSTVCGGPDACLQSLSFPKPALHYDVLNIQVGNACLYHHTIKTAVDSHDNSPLTLTPNLPSVNSTPGMGINTRNPQIACSNANPQPSGNDPATSHSNHMT
ncbi:hypothetical protein GH733_009766 [Mirounga leonina]|nr:hypothetical protein GH733_009766 [Mirounga leonina]